MSRFDLYAKLKSDKQFQTRLQELIRALDQSEHAYKVGKGRAQPVTDNLLEILRHCDYNASFLVPYFFPAYPGNDPLSFLKRPFMMEMMKIQVGGYTVFRAGRQVGKSTGIGARQQIYANILPKYRSLYICPHSQQAQTYAHRLEEMYRAFRYPEHGSKRKKNLYRKEFSNDAVIEVINVLTTADPSRGKSVDELLWDETDASSSLVTTYDSPKNVRDIPLGTRVPSFDNQGEIHEDTIVGKVSKGKRHVWKTTFVSPTNGGAVFREATGSSKFYTNIGWLALGELISWEEAQKCDRTYKIKTLLACATAVRPGDATWRRESSFIPAAIRQVAKYSQGCVRHDTWLEAGRILPDQSRALIELCKQASASCREQGVRSGELCVYNPTDPRVRFYVGPRLPTRSGETGTSEEGRHAGVARQTILGRSGLVVHGRRKRNQSRNRRAVHARLLLGRARNHSNLLQGSAGPRRQDPAAQTQRAENPLLPSHERRRFKKIRKGDQAAHIGLYEVQDQTTSRKVLQVLRRARQSARRASKQLTLHGSGMLTEIAPGVERPLSGKARQHSRRREGAGAAAGTTRASERTTRLSRKAERRAAEALLRSGVSRTTERMEAGMAARAQGSRTSENVGALTPTTLIDTTYAGRQNVYDIETEKNHTFFANGIAVHNCQNMDINLEPEVQQTQKASKTPVTIYAGTSLTLDTMLEAKWEDSSKGTWHIPSPDGTHWLNTGDKETVLKMIRPKGLTCPHTNRVIDPRAGTYIHEDRQMEAAGQIGLHIPQIIIPEYATEPLKWDEIYQSFLDYGEAKFLQEVIGIPVEESDRELTRADLVACCGTGVTDKKSAIAAVRSGRYKYVISGCDWGGSDYNPAMKTKQSYTVHFMLGIRPDGLFESLHFKRYAGMGYREIIDDIAENHHALDGYGMASDFGVGAAYNMLLREHPKMNPMRHVIFGYASQRAIISQPKNSTLFNHLSLNRTETMSTLIQMIKQENPRLVFRDWGVEESYLADFLNVYRVIQEAPGSGARSFTYRRHGSRPDDAFHAVNFAVSLARLVVGEQLMTDPALQDSLRKNFSGFAANARKRGVKVVSG